MSITFRTHFAYLIFAVVGFSACQNQNPVQFGNRIFYPEKAVARVVAAPPPQLKSTQPIPSANEVVENKIKVPTAPLQGSFEKTNPPAATPKLSLKQKIALALVKRKAARTFAASGTLNTAEKQPPDPVSILFWLYILGALASLLASAVGFVGLFSGLGGNNQTGMGSVVKLLAMGVLAFIVFMVFIIILLV